MSVVGPNDRNNTRRRNVQGNHGVHSHVTHFFRKWVCTRTLMTLTTIHPRPVPHFKSHTYTHHTHTTQLHTHAMWHSHLSSRTNLGSGLPLAARPPGEGVPPALVSGVGCILMSGWAWEAVAPPTELAALELLSSQL